jgi:hypothetical protein
MPMPVTISPSNARASTGETADDLRCGARARVTVSLRDERRRQASHPGSKLPARDHEEEEHKAVEDRGVSCVKGGKKFFGAWTIQ